MKDPCSVSLSFAQTGVLDGRIKHPGRWRPLIENCEDWFEKKIRMQIHNANLHYMIMYGEMPVIGVDHRLAR